MVDLTEKVEINLVPVVRMKCLVAVGRNAPRISEPVLYSDRDGQTWTDGTSGSQAPLELGFVNRSVICLDFDPLGICQIRLQSAGLHAYQHLHADCFLVRHREANRRILLQFMELDGVPCGLEGDRSFIYDMPFQTLPVIGLEEDLPSSSDPS